MKFDATRGAADRERMDQSGDKALKAARVALERLRERVAALDGGFPAVARLDDALAPTLAIAGEEGAGKSTLVNAIFGMPLVPTDANSPGTVASIAISADVTATPSYSVELHGSDERIVCADRSVFASYLLQRENPHNTKRVSQGVIQAAGPAWADGARLVDLPGLEGLSETLEQDVAAALPGSGRALLVLNDRNAAPGLRVASRIKALGGNVIAVIVNLRSSKLLDDETRKALAGDIAAGNISRIRAFVCEALERLGFDIPAACVFAIHLPAMRELELAANVTMNAPAHAAEVARFAAWFRASFGRAGAGARISQALEIASAVIDEHCRAGQAEMALLAGLRRGDAAAAAGAAAALAQRRKRLPGRWREALRQAGDVAAAERSSIAVQSAIQRLKAQLTDLHRNCRASLPVERWKWDVADENRIAAVLSREAAGAACEFQRQRDLALEAYHDVCRRAAEAVVEDDDILKTIEAPLHKADFASKQLWQAPRFEAGKRAILGLEWMWSAASIDRMLHEISHAEMTIDASRKGRIVTEFRNQLKMRRAAHYDGLRKRLDRIAAIAADPAHPALLAAERASKQKSDLVKDAQLSSAKCRRMLGRLTESDRIHAAKADEQRAKSERTAAREIKR